MTFTHSDLRNLNHLFSLIGTDTNHLGLISGHQCNQWFTRLVFSTNPHPF